jgi:hypothetical protein
MHLDRDALARIIRSCSDPELAAQAILDREAALVAKADEERRRRERERKARQREARGGSVPPVSPACPTNVPGTIEGHDGDKPGTLPGQRRDNAGTIAGHSRDTSPPAASDLSPDQDHPDLENAECREVCRDEPKGEACEACSADPPPPLELFPPEAPPAPLLTFETVGKAKAWYLRQAFVDECRAAYPDLDVMSEFRKAWLHFRTHPKNRKTADGMPGCLSAWLARAQNGGAPARASPQAKSRDLRVGWVRPEGMDYPEGEQAI